MKGTAHRECEAVHDKYLYQLCARPFEELEEDGEIGVLAISHNYVIVAVYFTTFESCIETLVGHVTCL